MNRHRGEIVAEFDGRPYRLCLTLGALAELESACAAHDLIGLAERLENGRLSARDLLKIIACGLRGGGSPLRDEEVAALASANGLAGYVDAAARLLAVTFGALDDGEGVGVETAPNPSLPQPPAPRRA